MVNDILTAWVCLLPDFCDYFLTYGMKQGQIPMECICLWRSQNFLRPDLNFSIATHESCSKYRESIARQIKRPLTKFPCYDPPCDEFGRPLPRPRARLHEHVPQQIGEDLIILFQIQSNCWIGSLPTIWPISVTSCPISFHLTKWGKLEPY